MPFTDEDVGLAPAAAPASPLTSSLPENSFARRSPEETSAGNVQEIEREIARLPAQHPGRAILASELEKERGKAQTAPVRVAAPTPQLFTDADVGLDTYTQKIRENLNIPGAKKVADFLGPGNLMAAADMFLSLPGQLMGLGADVGGRAAAFGSQEPRKVQSLAGEQGREMFEPVQNLIQKAAKWAGLKDMYDRSATALAMEKFSKLLSSGGEGIEKKTGGIVQKEDVDSAVNALMAVGGVAGLRAGVNAARTRTAPAGPRGSEPYEAQPAPRALSGPETPRLPGGEAGQTIEGEFSRVPEEQKVAALSGAKQWLVENKLPVAAAGALGTWMALNPDSDAAWLGLGVAASVKGKGGMWHPKAAEVLSTPIKRAFGTRSGMTWEDLRQPNEQLVHPQRPGADVHEIAIRQQLINELDADRTQGAHFDKLAQTYLNRHMGTETDPLKDIEIPFGEGTKKWGEVTDALVKSQPARDFLHEGGNGRLGIVKEERALVKNVPPDEPIYSLSAIAEMDDGAGGVIATRPARALRSYLSHVGDYLRENVPPEKLQQYDLVRAVKETAKKDEEMAKAMEREAAESSKDLPVYKDYGDGFKWVELKKAEKLTEGQLKGVKKVVAPNPPFIEASRLTPEARRAWDALPEDQRHTGEWVALGSDGKPVKNNYTDEFAKGKSPEEAHLAGQLAREGNQMGHCVGGYCEGVASGESRIFSLRDAKGKSHVTIEVEPAGAKPLDPVGAEHDAIIQIKGKQNRAPVAEYQKYVQDFVKSGKWGDVGDLENTGLLPHRTASGSQYPVESHVSPEQLKLEPGYYTKEEYLKAIRDAEFETQTPRPGEGYPRSERGSIDQRLLLTLAAAGLGALAGAALDDNAPGRGALFGALAAAAAARGLTKEGRAQILRGLDVAASAADYGLGIAATRLKNDSPVLYRRMMEFEHQTLKQKFDNLETAVPLMKGLDKIGGAEGAKLDAAILSNEPQAIRAELRKHGLEPAWNAVRGLLNSLGKELNAHGRFAAMLDDYFPRVVKDVKGLKKFLGQDLGSNMEKVLKEAEQESLDRRGRPLTEVEQSQIINRFLLRKDVLSGLPGFAKERSIHKVTESLLPFYYKPSQSLYMYVVRAVEDLEKMKLFGKNAVQETKDGKKFLDLSASIGNLLGEEMRKGALSPEQLTDLDKLLRSRFGPGEQAMPGWQQDFRNITNAMLLARPSSAVTQLGDAFSAVAHDGIISTIVGMGRALSPSKAPVSAQELGMLKHIADELGSAPRATAKFLDKSLHGSSFALIDQFGKNVNLNAALHHYQRLARSGKEAAIAKDYEKMFGEDFPQLLEDLKSGTKTPLTDSFAFIKLAERQPITKMHTTQFLMDHPKVRLLGQLKSFVLMQLDVARRQVYQLMKTPGRRAEGIGNGMKLAAVLGVSGVAVDAIKDLVLGLAPQVDLENAAEQVLKTFGLSSYVLDKAIEKKEPGAAAAGMITLPYKVFEDILKGKPEAVSYIPVLGQIADYWLLGGREREEAKREKRKLAKERKKEREE